MAQVNTPAQNRIEDLQPPTPLPSPPFHSVPGVVNLRDIGGYAVAASPTTADATAVPVPWSVRRNFIYRSAEPGKITEAGKAILRHDLGVTTIYDLRLIGEVAKDPPADIPGVRRVHVPMMRTEDEGPARTAWVMGTMMQAGDTDTEDEGDGGSATVAGRAREYRSSSAGFGAVYREFLTHGTPALRTLFTHVLSTPSRPFLVHCSGGKDRTGVFVALALRLAGVEDALIAAEYERTELGWAHLAAAKIEAMRQIPIFQGDRAALIRLVSAQARVMRVFLRSLDRDYGSAHGYLKTALGFGDEQIDSIRANLVVQQPAVL